MEKIFSCPQKIYTEPKRCCKVFICAAFILTLFSAKMIAQSVNIQITGVGINVLARENEKNLLLFPGLGVGYDFRNPAIRPGWSLMPMLIAASNIQKNFMNTFIFPTIVGRYRFILQEKFFCDFNIGSGLLIIYYPNAYSEHEGESSLITSKIKVKTNYVFTPLLSINFSYLFRNNMIAGINIAALYDFDSKHILPLVNINFIFPLSNSNIYFNRNRRR